MKTILTILCTLPLAVTMANTKPMTSSVKSWEGTFTLQQDPVAIHAKGKPKLFLWLYQLDQGSKGICIGFSRENDGMILAPKPNEKGVQPIYSGYFVLFGEDDILELMLTYDVQGQGGQKVLEKYTYDGKQIRLISQSQFFGNKEPIWKKIRGEVDEDSASVHLSESNFQLIREAHFQGRDLFQLAVQAGMYKRKGNEYLPGCERGAVSTGGRTWHGSNGVGLVAYDPHIEKYQIFYLQDQAVPGHHLDINYADDDFLLFSYGYHPELPNVRRALEVYSLKHRRFARIHAVATSGAKFGAFSMDRLKQVNPKAAPPSIDWNDRRYARRNYVELSEAGLCGPDLVELRDGIFRLSYHTGWNIEEFATVLKFKKTDLASEFEKISSDKPDASDG